MIVKLRLQRVTITIRITAFDSVQAEVRLKESMMAELILSLSAFFMPESVKKSC